MRSAGKRVQVEKKANAIEFRHSIRNRSVFQETNSTALLVFFSICTNAFLKAILEFWLDRPSQSNIVFESNRSGQPFLMLYFLGSSYPRKKINKDRCFRLLFDQDDARS